MILPERHSNPWPTHEQLDNARWHERATRRFVLKTGAGAAATVAAGSLLVSRTGLAQDSFPARKRRRGRRQRACAC